MRTPPLVVTYRAIIVVISLAIITLVALGMVGLGPLGALLGANGPKVNI
jgi:hypothetical protein